MLAARRIESVIGRITKEQVSTTARKEARLSGTPNGTSNTDQLRPRHHNTYTATTHEPRARENTGRYVAVNLIVYAYSASQFEAAINKNNAANTTHNSSKVRSHQTPSARHHASGLNTIKMNGTNTVKVTGTADTKLLIIEATTCTRKVQHRFTAHLLHQVNNNIYSITYYMGVLHYIYIIQ